MPAEPPHLRQTDPADVGMDQPQCAAVVAEQSHHRTALTVVIGGGRGLGCFRWATWLSIVR